jgi:hypothetical protein
MIKLRTIPVSILITAALASGPAHAARVMSNFHIGYALETVEYKYWKPGLSLGINLMFPVHPNVLVGGRLSYHRWTPENDPGLVGANWIAEGSMSLFEVYPSVRLTTSVMNPGPVAFYVQVGGGFAYADNNASLYIEPVVPDPQGWYVDLIDSQMRPGISVGAGMATRTRGRLRGEVLLLYNEMFTRDESLKFVTLNIGLFVGM